MEALPALPTEQNKTFRSLGPKDVETTTWELEIGLEKAIHKLQQVGEEKNMREIAGARIPNRVHTVINNIKSSIPGKKKKLELVRTMPIKLGRTLVSSGRKIADKVADWAFIDLDLHALNEDNSDHKNRMPYIPIADRPFDASDNSRGEPLLKEGHILDDFGSLGKGDWYCKTGRTTQLKTGICNGVSTYCNWSPANRQRFSKDGARLQQIEDGITEEWIITTEYVGPWGKKQGAFCVEGDSGAGIIDAEGRICGLLYGEAGVLCGHQRDQVSGLCSSIDNVKKWIEKMAPATLSLPE
ncbi:hypothetical protein BDW62DRAFT_194442 [Aspergillus aurantiobrunneus]